ncbi:MAG: multicopper oxidase domain-containing protein [Desulfobacterales bacterium]|nr:multicopper oxidase domain-containing protein [Desulfobacterales bacterium]
MRRPIFLLMGLALMVAVLPWGGNLAFGNTGPAGVTFYANSPSGGSTGTALSKFVDSLPGLSPAGVNNLGQYIPVAVADTTTYPGCDYYQIGIVDYTKTVHSNLPKPTKFRGYVDLGTGSTPTPQYLGPVIVAQRDVPVRLKVTNQLGTGAAGNLFLPVDITLMGAGEGPLGVGGGYYTQNRVSTHLHGAFTPWISDGTPHQWFTPAGETTTPYLKGASFQNVPDMPDPGAGSQTMYYTNQQSGRLMFYHDHAVGITRLNVYAGMAAGYLIHDPVEDNLIATGVIPDQGGGVNTWGIPLIIQDKTFVPQDVATVQDTKWNAAWGTYGDLYFPHIYEANQSLTSADGMNPYGRWDFGPWVQPNILAPVEVPAPELQAALPLPGTDVDHPENYLTSVTPESFMDVMMVNGTVYPYLNVEPKAYRFRILNACNDRFVNLQLYLDASGGGTGATATAVLDPATGGIFSVVLTNGGSGYVRAPGVNLTGGGGFGGMASTTVSGGVVTGITVTNPGSGYTAAPTVTIGATTEVSMVPAVPNGSYPPTWPKDGRDGGVPDPATSGPKFIQIGTEGGILPGVVVHPNQPINYDYDRGSATFGNVLNTGGGITIFIGPAERADVIVDFSGVAPGTNVILYNDAPSPVPGFQPRYDYYTGNPDLTATGGATQTQVGVGPNTRTIMQFRVAGTPAATYDVAALEAALPVAYVASQPPPIVPQTYYPGAYSSPVDYHARINATSLTYIPLGATVPKTLQAEQKAIVELFEPYGRMNATLGYEIFDPTANPARSNGIGFSYIDPPVEVFQRGQIQIWKVTHNGVDTHPVHIHLNNAQIINRVGWDGVIKPPEPFERGWKETIRMNPLESIFIAQKADLPTTPFAVPDSIRPLNPSRPLGDTTGFTNINPKTGQPITTTPTVNTLNNFGHEYVWHCHILGHEENDMMRPLKVTGIIPVGSLDMLLLVD